MRKVRIITYGYDADIVRFLGKASANVSLQHAENLLQDLQDIRKTEEEVCSHFFQFPSIWLIVEARTTDHFHLSQPRWNISETSTLSIIIKNIISLSSQIEIGT